MGGGSNVTIPANTWTKVTGSSVVSQFMNVQRVGAYNLSVVNGDVIWIDDFMITKSSGERIYYEKNSGASSGWSWTASVNQSASFGPALVEP